MLVLMVKETIIKIINGSMNKKVGSSLYLGW